MAGARESIRISNTLYTKEMGKDISKPLSWWCDRQSNCLNLETCSNGIWPIYYSCIKMGAPAVEVVQEGW